MDKQSVRGEKHQQAQLARDNVEKELRAEYLKVRKSIAVADILAKSKSFAAYHCQVAQDGVAYEPSTDEKGNPRQQIVKLTPEERVTHLDKAAGLQEMIDYIERKLTIDSGIKKEDIDG